MLVPLVNYWKVGVPDEKKALSILREFFISATIRLLKQEVSGEKRDYLKNTMKQINKYMADFINKNIRSTFIIMTIITLL